MSVITDPKTEMKIGVASPHLIPRHAICDPLLTVGAPPTVTAHAGIDALSHAVEAYMAAREEPSRRPRARAARRSARTCSPTRSR